MITFFRLVDDILNKKITLYVSQAAFFLLISIIPFIMVLLNILQFVPVDYMDTLNHLIADSIVPGISDVLQYILNQLYQQSNSTLMGATLLGMLWAASKGIYALERGLNIIYGNDKKNGYFFVRILSFLYMILFFITLVLLLLAMLLGRNTLEMIKPHLPKIFSHSLPPIIHKIMAFLSLIAHMRLLLVIPVMIFVFMILFTYFPGRSVRFRDQFFGAVISTIGWVLFTFGYSFYISNVSNYSAIYGSLGAVVLFCLWFYFGIMIIMFGAEFNAFRMKHGF